MNSSSDLLIKKNYFISRIQKSYILSAQVYATLGAIQCMCLNQLPKVVQSVSEDSLKQ